MNRIICYINNNYIDIKSNNKINHIVLNSINNNDIINSKKFINDIKKYHIFSNIINNEIDLYLNHIIYEMDIFYYNLIFEELNCTKINIYNTSKMLTSPTLIDNIDHYIVYYNDNYYNILPNYLPYFIDINKIKILKIISNKKIDNNNNIKYYYFNNYNNYFL